MNNVLEFPKRGKVEAEAVEWLILLDRDTPPTRVERQKLKEWLNASSAHRNAIKEVAELWGQINILTRLAVQLDLPDTPYSTSRFDISRLSFRHFGTAAAFLLLVVCALLVWNSSRALIIGDTNGIYSTVIGEYRDETLNDGSLAVLNTASRIEVAFDSQYRDIYLHEGQAHFSVAKDRDRPFRVFAGDVRISAVGTAFSVFLQGGNVDVLVTEGTVSLGARVSPALPDAQQDNVEYGSGMTALGLLEAGQVATIISRGDESSDLISVRDLGLARIIDKLSWREGVLTFTGQLLENVIEQVGDYTGVEFELADSRLRRMRIGGTLPIGKPDFMLAALESNFGLEISWLEPNKAVVSGRDFDLSEQLSYPGQKPNLGPAVQH